VLASLNLDTFVEFHDVTRFFIPLLNQFDISVVGVCHLKVILVVITLIHVKFSNLTMDKSTHLCCLFGSGLESHGISKLIKLNAIR
jgi:hypothetical protein